MSRPCPKCLAWEARFDGLLQQVIQMKREGFTVAPEYDAPIQGPQLPPAVRKIISDMGWDMVTARRLESQAIEDFKAGIPEETIIAHIIEGEPISA